ncbi:hypothetical protein M407DRAFT_104243 [Tulasnella calospora MUT 4182]|uniref:ubiquitinyl hydrolase 1 n=1 Tax=Tulasnella calospora MUT 4182 TaxID=1051891 RepID=A0A0C3KRE4_9AGAM|nr:hypothetical protein M407DRAFT_104243 [Tulasnella calospora MUT 4182]
MVQLPNDPRRSGSPEASMSYSQATRAQLPDQPQRTSQRKAGSANTAYYPPPMSSLPDRPREPTPPSYDAAVSGRQSGSQHPLPRSPSPSMPELAPADPAVAPGPEWGEYGSWGRTQPTWDYSGWQSAQPHELGDTSDSAEDRWWHKEYMEHISPRPGPGCLPPRAATMIHGTFHQLYKVTVTPPNFPTTDAQPAGNPQRSPSIGQSGSSAGPSVPSAGVAQHRPPSESEVRYLIPHPYVQFCRRDMVWVYHQVKSSMYLPTLLPNSGTLPNEVVRKTSPTCVEVDETGIRDMSFSSNKAKTHHFHHYPKSVKGSSLNPPFVRRKIDLETAAAAADKRRRASNASSSSRHRAEAASLPTSESTEILLDLWVCCQCQTYVISSGPEAVIPSILDGVLLQHYIRDRENEPTTRPSKEETVVYSLETILRIMENFLFKLDNRMVKVGANLIKKIGWTPASQEFLTFLGFQHTPVPASENESHPEGRLQPPKLAEGSPDTDMKRARLLQAWLELSIITQHYRKKNDRTLQAYESQHKMWVSIENTFEETRRQIGAHETQIKQMPLTQSALIHENARIFWDGLGTTPETHSAEVVKFAYRRQTHCDPQNTALYFYFLKGVNDWAMRVRHSSAEGLQILVSQEESRGRWSTDDMNRAAIFLGFLTEEDLTRVNDVQLPPNFRENLMDAWLTRVKEVNTEVSENRITRQIADDRKRDLKESFRILAEYSGSPELVQAFRQTMRMYGNGMVDVQDAYNTLEVPKELDEDMVITIYNMRVEDQPNLRERMLSALLIIGEDRNSSRLKNLALTGTDEGPPPPESSHRDWPRGLQQLGNTCYLNSLLQYFYTIKDLREAISTLDVSSETAISDEEIKQGRVGGRLVTKREVERSKKFVNLLRDLFMQLEWSTEQAVKPELELAKLALVTSKDEEDDVNSERSDATNTSSLRSQSTLVEEPMPMGPLPQSIPRAPGSPSSSTGAVADDSAPASPPAAEHFEGTRHASLEAHHGSMDEVKDGFVVVDPPRRVTIAETAPATQPSNTGDGDVAMQDSGEQEKKQGGNPPPLPPRKKATEGGMMFGKQHDVSECMDNCMFQIEAAMKFGMEKIGLTAGDSESSVVKRLFYGKMRQRISVLPGAGPSSAPPSSSSIHEKEDLFSQLLVNVDDEGYDLYDGISGRFDDNIDFEGKQAHMDTSIVDLPPILQVQLQRVQFNRETLEAYKSNAYVKFGESLFMDRFLAQADPQKKARSKEIERKLRSCRERLSELTKGTGIPYDKALTNTYNMITQQNLFPLDADLLHDLGTESELLKAELAQCREEAASLKAALEELWKDDRKVEYELSSVFIHRGSSPSFGHYFFYARDLPNNPDKWLKYNDQDVASVPKAEVLANTTGSTANPYLLVFARKGANVIDIIHRANLDAADVDMLDL